MLDSPHYLVATAGEDHKKSCSPRAFREGGSTFAAVQPSKQAAKLYDGQFTSDDRFVLGDRRSGRTIFG